MNGTSLSNKKATVKSLTSKRLTDFLEDTKNSYKANDDVAPSIISNNVTDSHKHSVLNLESTSFGMEEMVDEAPVLFVGSTSLVNHSQNLHDIIESYRIFKEITSTEEKDAEFGLVINKSNVNDNLISIFFC